MSTARVSQPPPQNASRYPKSRFSPPASMPRQVICTGLMASIAGVNLVVQQFAHTAAAMEHDFGPRALLHLLPHDALAGLEKFAVHRWRNLRPLLAPEVVAEQNHIHVFVHGGEETVE